MATPARARAIGWLTRHGVIFAAVNTGLLAADLMLPGRPFFFYVLLFWGAGLAAHVFLVKALHVDPGWAERRAERLRDSSYDRRHMGQIAADPHETRPPE